MQKKWVIFGGAGFIGSHFVDHLLASPETQSVLVVDNFSSGSRWHLASHVNDARLQIVERDVHHIDELLEICSGHEIAVHLASNPDIARAALEPTVDFYDGTLLTQSVLEVCRRAGVKTFVYASGSGVYGDCGETLLREDHSPLEPTSTYGASKLAGESLLSSYCHMFGFMGRAFRFANVVGRRQTHGVAYDFIRRLKTSPEKLDVLGNGLQSKPYIHVSDVIEGVLAGVQDDSSAFKVYNVAPLDYANVREIVSVVTSEMELEDVTVHYGPGPTGWKGDVPVVRLSSDRLRQLGWRSRFSSQEALRESVRGMLADWDTN